MKKNVGTIDRSVRFIVSAVLIYVGFFDNQIISGGIFRIIIGIMGVVIFMSALFSVCPMYWVVDIDTAKND
jgi:hypothetical protein